jgi:hypothetical protein
MRELTAEIEPLLAQALVTAFHRSLADQLLGDGAAADPSD